MERKKIRGLCLDSTTLSEAVDFAADCALNKRLCKVYTPGTELAWHCLSDKDCQELINKAELLCPDGIGVVIASKLVGSPLSCKVAGVEFGEGLIAKSSTESLGIRFFLLGGKPGIAEEAAKKLGEKYPGAIFCGTHHGYFEKSGNESDEVVKKIKDSGADAVYVCFGQPSQEKWIEENAAACGASVYAALGGSLDIYSGTLKRAPKFFVSLGLEWLYRLIKEPKRIGRMMCLPKYLFSTLFCVIFRKKSL